MVGLSRRQRISMGLPSDESLLALWRRELWMWSVPSRMQVCMHLVQMPMSYPSAIAASGCGWGHMALALKKGQRGIRVNVIGVEASESLHRLR